MVNLRYARVRPADFLHQDIWEKNTLFHCVSLKHWPNRDDMIEEARNTVIRALYRTFRRFQMKPKRSEHFFQKSARCLARANALSERGKKVRAEELYRVSARWLGRANELKEQGR